VTKVLTRLWIYVAVQFPYCFLHRVEQGHGDGVMLLSNFASDRTQVELPEALVTLGKYERVVMRTFLAFPTALSS
jgi:hypothetical protein